ncbi:MAG: hypothetical protein CMH46_18575 [Muricauda sp.]|nr:MULTISPECIES: carboxypeptidase-like regulatory domain-containing protein [unclassified Allomuricauda]MAU17537.1 hypothetical protein [Allomuricauda sp.]|tara:strand:+ start:2496 stop:5165 length:2670 start_codon:yes stop_codon:yes gene_type:complete
MRCSVVFILVVILYGGTIRAQTSKFYGKVTDSLENPLAFATILAKPLEENKQIQFTTTNDLGEFEINLFQDTQYDIQINLLGFAPYSFIIITENDIRENIVLKEDITQLDEVVVELELPIQIKKDTIVYRVSNFNTGGERTLKDVLGRLPGIEVDDQGNIISQGKKVTHVLVENKSFFGGNSKLAVDNIPADVVKDVEVIDDYNVVSFLKGLTRTDNLAVNIKLQEDKKNFAFGNIEVGKGNDDFYESNANIFLFNPNLNLNIIGGTNNIGENILKSEDYQRFVGGNSVLNARDYADEQLLGDTFEIGDVFKSKNTTGAINFNKTPHADFDISGYYIFTDNKQESIKENINEYLTPNSTITENLHNSVSIDNKIGLGNIKVKYRANTNEEFSIGAQIKHERSMTDTFLSSIIDNAEQLFESNKPTLNLFANINVEWHKKISKEHGFSLVMDTNVNSDHSDELWDTNRTILDSLVPISSTEDNLYQFLLNRENYKNSSLTVYKHYWNINSNNLLHFTIGNHIRNERFATNDTQILEEGTNSFKQNGFDNNLNLRWNDFYFGIFHNFGLGSFDVHQSLFIHNLNWKTQQTNSFNENKWVILPELSIRKGQSGGGGLIRLDAKLESTFSKSSELANRFYLQSYNSVYQGNGSLENQLSFSTSLNYVKSSLLRGTYILGVLGYSRELDAITNTIVLQNQDRVVLPDRINKPYENFRANLIYRKSTELFRYGLRSDVSYNLSSTKINNDIKDFGNFKVTYQASVQTLSQGFPTIKVGIGQTLGNYNSDESNYSFVTTEPFVNINYEFFKNFLTTGSISYYQYVNRSFNERSTYSLADFSLSYQNDKNKLGFEFSIRNILNVNSKNSNSFSNFIVSDENTFILPRIMMFTIKYKL